MQSTTDKLKKARARNKTFEIAKVLAAYFADQPKEAMNELALESPFVRVAFLLLVRGITSRLLADALGTHENYISRCITKQAGLTRKWQKVAQYFDVPQGWLAFGVWNGESSRSAIEIIKGAKSVKEVTTEYSTVLNAKSVKVYSPRELIPVQLRFPAFGYPRGMYWLTVQRAGKMSDKVILEMNDGSWKAGWMMLPGWEDRGSFIAPDAETGGPDLKAAFQVPLDQIQSTYIAVAPMNEPLRESPAIDVFEADLPDDHPDDGEEDRP